MATGVVLRDMNDEKRGDAESGLGTLSVAEPEEVRVARCEELLREFPGEGLFSGLSWHLSPEPLQLAPETVALLEKLGPALQAFNEACNRLYLASTQGKQPDWIARWLDAGKPRELIEFARSKRLKNELPRVIRPDVLLTEEGGLCICELDSVPGGIGATAWLQEAYARVGRTAAGEVLPGFDLMGGADGMRRGWREIFPEGDVVISEEAATYRPEMEWLNAAVAGETATVSVCDAASYEATPERAMYRFFEAFDLHNLPRAEQWMQAVQEGALMTPPLKPYLEEKLWIALFWLRPLKEFWRQELGDKTRTLLEKIFPYAWVLDPTPLPPHGAMPRLEIQDWRELEKFSQKERRLVLKISGFSPQAWGSRGVYFGHDLSGAEWAEVVRKALAEFEKTPYTLQQFESSRSFMATRYDAENKSLKPLRARARLCPYYFAAPGQAVRLGGVLATLCPADKKALHGMSDAIMTVASRG